MGLPGSMECQSTPFLYAHCSTALLMKLRPVVGADLQGQSALDLQTVKHTRHPDTAQAGIDFDGRRLAAEVVGDIQGAEAANPTPGHR